MTRYGTGGKLEPNRTQVEVLATYTLQLIGPASERDPRNSRPMIAPDVLRETEENLTDLLPDGYSARIGEWDGE